MAVWYESIVCAQHCSYLTGNVTGRAVSVPQAVGARIHQIKQVVWSSVQQASVLTWLGKCCGNQYIIRAQYATVFTWLGSWRAAVASINHMTKLYDAVYLVAAPEAPLSTRLARWCHAQYVTRAKSATAATWLESRDAQHHATHSRLRAVGGTPNIWGT